MEVIINIKRIDDKTVEFQSDWFPYRQIKGSPKQTKRFLRKYGEQIENNWTWKKVKLYWWRFKILGW